MTENQAACAGVLEPLWDARLEGESPKQQNIRHTRALGYCRRCPIRAACASQIDVKHDDGVRGGILLPTIYDRDRRSVETYQPGRGGIARLLSA